jgi:5-methylcytosine-specific restriction endonuclease McrA
METFRSDVDLAPGTSVETGAFLEPGQGIPTVRCYRCGDLLTEQDLTIDRVTPARLGGRYHRDNIRPACGPCNFGSNRHLGRWEDEQ